MSKIEIAGKIGYGCEADNAHTIETRTSYNGSGEDAFGGAREWPTVWAEINFQSHEGQRAVVFASKLTELVHAEFAKDTPRTIQCSGCPNHEQAGEFTEQELIDDGWLLEPVVYCPRCGPDEERSEGG